MSEVPDHIHLFCILAIIVLIYRLKRISANTLFPTEILNLPLYNLHKMAVSVSITALSPQRRAIGFGYSPVPKREETLSESHEGRIPLADKLLYLSEVLAVKSSIPIKHLVPSLEEYS